MKNKLMLMLLTFVVIPGMWPGISRVMGEENVLLSDSPRATPIAVLADENLSVPDDWKTLISKKYSFSIQYPPDMHQEDELKNAVRLFRMGPSQQAGTELDDGLVLTFGSGDLKGSLAEVVMMKHQESEKDPLIKAVSPIQPMMIGEYQAYSFTLQGGGEFTQYYLPNGNDKYLLVTDASVDPLNQGYEKTVELMLSTLRTGL